MAYGSTERRLFSYQFVLLHSTAEPATSVGAERCCDGRVAWNCLRSAQSRKLSTIERRFWLAASQFHQIGKGKTAQEAFRYARDVALWENGRKGYTGTLAEKDDFVIISKKPMPRKEAAELSLR